MTTSHRPFLAQTCTPGRYADGAGLGSCLLCPAGTYQPDPASDRCLPCPPGEFQGQPGQTECLPCQPGKFSSTQGSPECRACPVGSFVNETRARGCELVGFVAPWSGKLLGWSLGLISCCLSEVVRFVWFMSPVFCNFEDATGIQKSTPVGLWTPVQESSGARGQEDQFPFFRGKSDLILLVQRRKDSAPSIFFASTESTTPATAHSDLIPKPP